MPRKPDPDARRKLLDAARAAFADVGVEAARIEDITRSVGLSKGSFYLHFESKEQAYEELTTAFFAVLHDLQLQRHEACRVLIDTVGPLTADDWHGPSARRQAWAACDHEWSVRMLDAMWRHRDVVRIVMVHSPTTMDRFLDVVREVLTAQLQEAARLGGLRPDLDGDIVSDLLIGAWLQLARRMLRSPRKPDFELWARTVDTLLFEGLADRRVSDRSVTLESA